MGTAELVTDTTALSNMVLGKRADARLTMRSAAADGRASEGAAPAVSVFLRRLLLCHCSRARHVLQAKGVRSHRWLLTSCSSAFSAAAEQPVQACKSVLSEFAVEWLAPFLVVEVCDGVEDAALLAVAALVARVAHLQRDITRLVSTHCQSDQSIDVSAALLLCEA